ncbi:MAG: hypothetical protein J0H08_03045 [Rhizobiales bacterium]|nr:hypothetical protein [Hyphomicrobiales bacterium]
MKNITLAVDEAVLEEVRRFAARRNTSVNALVREHLARIAKNENRVRDAMRELREMSDRSDAEVGPITWTRDALYDR